LEMRQSKARERTKEGGEAERDREGGGRGERWKERGGEGQEEDEKLIQEEGPRI
jgi:hypothetical protein